MRILLVTRGSQGDIYPYLRLAKELIRRSHTVTLNLPATFEKYASDAGVNYTIQGRENVAEVVLEKGSNTKDLLAWTRSSIDNQFKELIPQLQEHDILVAANSELAAPSIAEYLKKPYIRTAFAPFIPSRIIPPPHFQAAQTSFPV